MIYSDVLILFLNYLRTSEGKTFVLLRLREDVIGIQISAEPDKNNYGKQYKARPVFHCCKKGKQKNPEYGIVKDKNYSIEWIGESLFNRYLAS